MYENEINQTTGIRTNKLLTAEQEIELSRTIEDAEKRILELVSQSRLALDALHAMCVEAQEQALTLDALLRVPPDPKTEGAGALEEVVQLTARLKNGQRPRGARGRTEPSARLAPARARFISVLLPYRLSHQTVTGIIEALRRAQPELDADDRAAVKELESELAENLQRSERARTRMVSANLALVSWLVGKRLGMGLSRSDLIQEGSLGLLRAIEKFDHRRGIRFNTYAIWWIRAFINRALSDQTRTIRVPVHMLETRAALDKKSESFARQHGRAPTAAELASETGLSANKVRRIQAVPAQPRSLDAPLGSDPNFRLEDVTPAPDQASPLEGVTLQETEQHVRDLLGVLPAREQEILKLRFGIDYPDCLTLAEIGKQLSLSRERIRQIVAEALHKLRELAQAQESDVHLAS